MKNILTHNLKKIINVSILKIRLQTFLLFLFSILFLCIGLPSLYERIAWCDGYVLGDWMINYEDGGFKRRGLSGSMFIFLSNLSGIYVGKIVFSTIAILYISFLAMLIYYFRKIRFDFSFLLFLLLPTTLLFPLNDLYAFGRKEVILFNLFIFFVIAHSKGITFTWKFILFFSFLTLIATLFHELVVFYVPYIMLVYLRDYIQLKKGNLSKILIIGLSTFVPAFLIFIYGAAVNEGGSWLIFKELGISNNIMEGIFSWPKEGFGKGQVNALQFASKNNYSIYFLSYIITFSVFLIVLIKNKIGKITFYQSLVFHFLLLTLSFPIFFLTIDWGRWLNIHFICMLLLVSLYYPKIKSLDTFSIQINDLQSVFFYIKIFVLFLFMFGFTMKHVDIGFQLGQNNLLVELRDIFWQIRNFKF